MATARENFHAWYASVVRDLIPNPSAGFPIALVTFPLLERYVRQRIGLPGHARTNPSFLTELVRLFPELGSPTQAQTFWTVYRHGLLHEVALAKQSRGGSPLPVGWLSHDTPLFSIDANGDYWLNPVKFAERVLATIEADFHTFEVGTRASPALPQVKTTAGPPHIPVVTGTSGS